MSLDDFNLFKLTAVRPRTKLNIICKTDVRWTHQYKYQQYFYSDCTICVKLDFENISSDLPGRPKVNIPKTVLRELRGLGFSWNKISKMFQVSRWTIYRRTREFELEGMKQFSDKTITIVYLFDYTWWLIINTQ